MIPGRALSNRMGCGWFVVGALVVSVGATSCADPPTLPVPPAAGIPRAATLASGDTAAGLPIAPVLTWLAPLGPGPADPVDPDTSATPVVTVCRWTGTACATTPEATFAMTSGPGVAPLTRLGGVYAASWSLLPGRYVTRQTYRIRVTQGARELGALSVDMVRGRWASTRADGTLAPLTAAATLPIQFTLTRGVRLGVVLGAGAAGTPGAGGTAYAAGTAVPYAFTPTPGHRNLRVLLDGDSAPSEGTITMTADHVIVVDADSLPVVPPTATPLVPLATALLRASNPDAASRAETAFSTAFTALRQAVGPEEAQRELAAVTAVTFDPVRDSAAFRRFTQALAASAPTPAAVARLTRATPRRLGSMSGAAASVPHPTTVVYVNGILTSPAGFAEGSAAVEAVQRDAASDAGRTDVVFTSFLNASWLATPGSGRFACLYRVATTAFLSAPGRVLLARACAPGLEGPREVVRQYVDGLRVDPQRPEPRAADLAVLVRRLLDAGQSVVLVGHSQGNLMAQQALRSLATSRAEDLTRCVAVVSVSPPVTDHWPTTPRASVFASGARTRDILLDVLDPKPVGDLVHTNVTDAADAEVAAFDAWAVDPEYQFSALAALSVRLTQDTYRLTKDVGLHFLVGSYLEGDATHAVIRRDLAASLRGLSSSCMDAAPPPPADTGVLGNGRTVTGHIRQTGQVDHWTFTGAKDDNIVWGLTGTGAQTSDFRPTLTIRDPAGRIIDYRDTGLGKVSFQRLSVDGTYSISVSSLYGVGTGDYLLTLIRSGLPVSPSPGDEGGAITSGATYHGHLYSGDVDGWTFTAAAGERILFQVGRTGAWPTGLVPIVSVIGPPRQTLVNGGLVNVPGLYTLIVTTGDSLPAGGADYQLTMLRSGAPMAVSPGDEGGAVTNGATHHGHLDPQDLDGWTFHADSGQVFAVGIGYDGPRAANFSFSLNALIYGPKGDLATGAIVSEGEVGIAIPPTKAMATGTYLVVVRNGRSATDSRGTPVPAIEDEADYRLTVITAPGALTATAGDEGGTLVDGVHGSLYPGDIDAWQFTASEGDDITVTLVAATSPTPYVPVINVVGPTGALGSGGRIPRALRSGVYTVLVRDLISRGPGGDYQLFLAIVPHPTSRASTP